MRVSCYSSLNLCVEQLYYSEHTTVSLCNCALRDSGFPFEAIKSVYRLSNNTLSSQSAFLFKLLSVKRIYFVEKILIFQSVILK